MIARRTLLGLIAAFAALRQGFARTPDQTAGPFYPPPGDRFADTDADLVKIEGAVREAGGEVMHLAGRVLREGAPLADAVVEIWQCDAGGRYLHHRDSGGPPRDPAFQGYGALRTGADGAYRFRTIRPVPYPGRTPHIHVRVTLPGGEALTTQFYLADEPLNARDGIWRRLSEAEREAVALRPARRGDGDLEAARDILL